MIDMTKTTIPKSDQLNADDLWGQTKTIKVTKVSLLTEADQPIAIGFEGDNGKPYKPCKSMRRVMVNCWGPDGNAYIGRSMTIYRDDKVAFGGLAVGGIRISHMSHIDGPVTMALTATRASRKPYTVKPLAAQASPPREPETVVTSGPDYRALGADAASRGKAAFAKFWNGLSREHRDMVGGKTQRDLWLAIATKADEGPPDDDLPEDFDEQTPSPAPVFTPNEHGPGQAAADASGSVENGPGSATTDLEDGPGPDPQGTSAGGEAPHGDSDSSGGPTTLSGAVDGRSRPTKDGAGGQTDLASPAPSDLTPATPAENAVLADLIARGNAAAAEGPAAILNFLGDLPKATKAMLPEGQILAWNRTADRRARK